MISETAEHKEALISDFRRDGSLMRRKLLEYLPAMMMTSLSNLLLTSVDGLVVGNLLGNDALASVNLFGPIETLIGAASVLASAGISTTVSTAIGSNEQEEINRARGASFFFMIISAVLVSVVQIPIVYLIIQSYHLDAHMQALVWQYAVWIMICSPFNVLSTIGVQQLQILGKIRVLMRLAVMEGLFNLLFDLLFVGGFHMGVAGAGIGTTCAVSLRVCVTVLYLARRTDIYKRDGYKLKLGDLFTLIRAGAPDCSYMLMTVFQSYFLMQILLHLFGVDGGIIKGVCTFGFSLASVLISGIQGSMRPLVGLLSGADDRKGLSELMKNASQINFICVGISVLVIWLFPSLFYLIHGVRDIPEAGILSLRLYALCFIVKGCNVILRLYLTNRKDARFATRLNLIGYAALPLIAYLLSQFTPAAYVWLAYLITETFLFVILYSRFHWWKEKDKAEDYCDARHMVLYMTVTPQEAVPASRLLRKIADENEINPRIANRVALCMEEMVAYADEVKEAGKYKQHIDRIKEKVSARNKEFGVQVMVRFKGADAATFTTLDDGKSISLDMDEDERKLTADNYEVLRRLAKSMEYQHILDMNYTTLKFEV